MCQPKPGRRCASHTRQEVNALQEKIATRYENAEAEWRADPENAGKTYSVAKGLDKVPVGEYALRSLEGQLDLADQAYLATDTGTKEATARLKELASKSDRTTAEKNELIDLKGALEKASIQNGVRDSTVSEMRAYRDHISVESTERGARQEIARIKTGDDDKVVDGLQAYTERMHSEVKAGKERVDRWANTIDQDITHGRDPSASIASWKTAVAGFTWDTHEHEVANRAFMDEMGTRRAARRAEKAAFGARNMGLSSREAAELDKMTAALQE